jgi:DNA-binding GntR family transcriptional regulator
MTRAVALAAIERTTLNDLAYDRLKRAILSGHIEQGMTLTLRQLAADLGTSMMPVREAVTRLSAEQALMVIPNRGICIPPLGAAEATDLWNLRINLEGEATAQAARRASPDECAAIGRLAKELNKTILKHDLHAMLECNSDPGRIAFQKGPRHVLHHQNGRSEVSSDPLENTGDRGGPAR